MEVLEVFLKEGHSIGVLPTADTVVIEDAKYSLGLLSAGGKMSWPHGTKWSPDMSQVLNKRSSIQRLYSVCLFLVFYLFLLFPEQLRGF